MRRGVNEKGWWGRGRWIQSGITKVTKEEQNKMLGATWREARIQEMKRKEEKKKYELTAHRESLRRDTNRGVRSQPDMQCTRRPLPSETTHSSTLNCSINHCICIMNSQDISFTTQEHLSHSSLIFQLAFFLKIRPLQIPK